MKKEKADLELLKLTIESREFKIKTLIEENDYWRWEAKKLKEELEKWKYGNSLAFDDIERICNEKLALKEENKKLKEKVRFLEECLDRKEKLNEKYRKEIDNKKLSTIAEETISDLQARIKELKDRIDVLYEFIERNDKLVDEVIDEEDLDKLNRYIYIDDDLVDRTLESED